MQRAQLPWPRRKCRHLPEGAEARLNRRRPGGLRSHTSYILPPWCRHCPPAKNFFLSFIVTSVMFSCALTKIAIVLLRTICKACTVYTRVRVAPRTWEPKLKEKKRKKVANAEIRVRAQVHLHESLLDAASGFFCPCHHQYFEITW